MVLELGLGVVEGDVDGVVVLGFVAGGGGFGATGGTPVDSCRPIVVPLAAVPAGTVEMTAPAGRPLA